MDHLNLSDRQKTRLLSLGLEPDRPAPSPDGNEQRGDLLCDLLRCPLPADTSGHDAPSLAASKPYGGFRTVAGPSLGELLQDPATDVETLQRVKEYAKTLGRDAGDDVQKDVFLAVYFAAIAAAVVFHARKITAHADPDLPRFLESFAKAAWIPADLADLLARAAQGCRTSTLPADRQRD